jgi:hypothetical protein
MGAQKATIFEEIADQDTDWMRQGTGWMRGAEIKWRPD